MLLCSLAVVFSRSLFVGVICFISNWRRVDRDVEQKSPYQLQIFKQPVTLPVKTRQKSETEVSSLKNSKDHSHMFVGLACRLG